MPEDAAIKSEVGSDRLEPFAPGDMFLGATLLNNPGDDHAGDGRIFQFDKDFNQKAVLHTPDTTHLVKGLMFGPDDVLWAFDASEHMALQIGPDGRRRSNPDLPKRPWSSGFFDPDGNLYLYEHLTGTLADVMEKYRPMQKVLPGTTDRIGDGNVYKFSPEGEMLDTYETETSTSFAGYLGVTSCALHPSGKYLTYTTETSKRVMRYDVVNHRQMEDLVRLPEDQREYVFSLNYTKDGTLLVTRSGKIEIYDDQGNAVRAYPLSERGWATIKESCDGKYIFVSSFFKGCVAKFDKETGEEVGRFEVHAERALAGFAEFPG